MAMPGERDRTSFEIVKPVYETRYRLINTTRPLSYTDAYGAVKRTYPHEALAILWMYQNTSANAKYYTQVANFKYRTSNYQYTSESFGSLRVGYNILGGATAAALTKSPSLGSGRASNEAASVKRHLLAYLEAKDFNAMNFNFEQQFNLKECSWQGSTWQCNNLGKKRMLIPFKLIKGQIDSEAGAFYGASVEPDPDDGVTAATPDAQIKEGGTVNLTYYSNDAFADFYKQPQNANFLAPYEPDNETYTLVEDKASNYFGGWFSGTKVETNGTTSTLNIANDFGTHTFQDEIPIAYAISSGNPDPRTNTLFDCSSFTEQEDIDLCLAEQVNNPAPTNDTNIYDLMDRYQTMQTSMTNSTQCFFPERDGSSSCDFDVSEILTTYKATKLNLKMKSRFILDSIISANFDKNISYDYCLNPILAENASARYKIKQFETTRSYAIDTAGQLVNTTQSTELIPVNLVTLPEPVTYAINNFTWERNSVYTDSKGNQYNTDDIFTTQTLDITKASLYQREDMGIYVGNTQFMPPESNFTVRVNKTGIDDTQKAWSCDESFLPYVQNEISKINQMCGTTPKVANYSLTRDNGTGMCKAQYTSNETCVNNPIAQENTVESTDPTTGEVTTTTTITMIDNYEWTNQSTVDISLPAGGEACSETCFANEGVKTRGYCSWRETNTGRKYHP